MAEATVYAPVALDMTPRYLGLVVVPGTHIVKIQVEKFSSQLSQAERELDMNKSTANATAE